MTDSEILENYQQPLPVSFRVIGVGTDTAGIIEKVKSFGYDCVGCIVVQSPGDCIPVDEDQMAIIVAHDNEDMANAIAKTYHDAGVLTIGLIDKAACDCYDSIAVDAHFNDYPEIIKTLLQPIVTQGYITFDYHDLSMELRDSEHFKTLTVEAGNVETAIAEIQKSFDRDNVKGAEYISFHLYWSRDRQPAVTVGELKNITNLISSLPETVNAMWTVNFDDAMPADKIRLSIIISGKKLR